MRGEPATDLGRRTADRQGLQRRWLLGYRKGAKSYTACCTKRKYFYTVSSTSTYRKVSLKGWSNARCETIRAQHIMQHMYCTHSASAELAGNSKL